MTDADRIRTLEAALTEILTFTRDRQTVMLLGAMAFGRVARIAEEALSAPVEAPAPSHLCKCGWATRSHGQQGQCPRYERVEVPAPVTHEAADRDALAVHPTSCSVRRDGLTCTRTPGHEGEHVAAGVEEIYDRWSEPAPVTVPSVAPKGYGCDNCYKLHPLAELSGATCNCSCHPVTVPSAEPISETCRRCRLPFLGSPPTCPADGLDCDPVTVPSATTEPNPFLAAILKHRCPRCPRWPRQCACPDGATGPEHEGGCDLLRDNKCSCGTGKERARLVGQLVEAVKGMVRFAGDNERGDWDEAADHVESSARQIAALDAQAGGEREGK